MRKSVRRGKRKNKISVSNLNYEWSIYYTNIRGFKSKADSLSAIVNGINPNLIVLNEHGLKFREKMKKIAQTDLLV